MTTITTTTENVEVVVEETTTPTDTVVVAEEAAIARREYKGATTQLELTPEQQHIAAEFNDRVKRESNSTKLSRKEFYATAEKCGINPEILKSAEQFIEDAAIAFHAVLSEDAITTFKDNKETETYTGRMEVGKNTVYKDTYSRFDSRSVSQGAGADRKIQETHGYHNPSIKTKFKGFEDQRQAVHALAKDLLG